MEEELFPDIRVVCPDCGVETSVPSGTDIVDVLWLHLRRCDGSAPELIAVCPSCDREVPVLAGLSPGEALWMHDHECPEAIPSFDVAS
jgi:hypothetical protein